MARSIAQDGERHARIEHAVAGTCWTARHRKTTLAKRLVTHLRGAYVRLDAIVIPVLRSALTKDEARAASVGYDIALGVARENLEIGVPVIVDGLNATHVRREEWVALAATTGATSVFVETFLCDQREHRRRIEHRSSADSGYLGPSWEEIQTMLYEPWDVLQTGERLALETSDSGSAFASVLRHLNSVKGER